MGSKHCLTEYAFARDVVKEFPRLIKELEKTRKMLYDHTTYAAVQHSVQALNESLEIMEAQLRYYSEVLRKKGKDDR